MSDFFVKMDDFKRDIRTFNDNLLSFKKDDFANFIGEELVAVSEESFRDQKDAVTGESWKQSARAKIDGGMTLTNSAQLRRSIAHKLTAAGVAAGTNKIYADVHNKGKEIKAKTSSGLVFYVGGRWVRKQSVKMPMRRFLGVPGDFGKRVEGYPPFSRIQRVL